MTLVRHDAKALISADREASTSTARGKQRYRPRIVLIVVLFLCCVHYGDGACSSEFPANLQGTWVTSNRGTWTVTANQIQNFKVTVVVSGSETRDFDCYDDSYNGYYILRSNTTFRPFTTIETYIYVCLNLNQVSTNKYTYQLLATLKAITGNVYERVAVYATSVTPTSSNICNDTETSNLERTHVALRNGSESSGYVTLPTSIQGTWSYNYTNKPCNTSEYVDTCTDKTLFNYTVSDCNPMFSSGKTLYCVYYGTSGSDTFVTLYNDETSVTNPTTYRFTCLVYSVSGSTVYMTTNPEECLSSSLQTSTSITSTYGKVVTFTDISTTPCNSSDTSSSSLIWLYVLIAILVLALIVGIIILIYCILKRRRRRKPIPDEEQQIKEEEEERRENEEADDRREEDERKKEEDDDTKSVDSGFIPDKNDKEEQDKIIPVAESEIKKEEEVKTDGEGEKDELKDRPDTVVSRMSDLGSTVALSEAVSPRDEQMDPERESDSEGGGSGADSDDPSEIERRIQMVGMKRPGHQYIPEGELSKVLVTRDMEEKSRLKKMKGKRKKGLHKFVQGKTKKSTYEKREGAQSPDSNEDEEGKVGGGGVKAAFMEQYQNKKRIEKILDDEHYWSDDDKKLDDLKFEDYDDDEFDVFPDDENKNDDVILEEVKDGSDISVTAENENNHNKEQEKDRGKDSGNDSPGMEQTMRDDDNDVNVDSDPDMRDVEDIEDIDDLDPVYMRGSNNLPPGFIRDTQGRIIRVADGQIISEDEMEKYFNKTTSRIKRLFNIARLKRNKKGRPTGGFIEDSYGPEVTTREKAGKGNITESQEEPRRKQSRASSGLQLLNNEARRKSQAKADFTTQRTVAFDVDDVSDIIKIDDDADELKRKGRRDISTPNRDLLKKRLFKTKKKHRNENGGHLIFVSGMEEKPRELNSLVKVYGRHGAPFGGPPDSRQIIGVSRTESGRGQMDQEQLQNFRQGLANDRKFLDRKGGGFFPVKEAFGGGDNLMVDDLSDEDRRLDQTISLGSEDEFVVVGGNKPRPITQNEPFFTIVRRPDQMHGQGYNHGNRNPWHTPHDLRHSIPWSLRTETAQPSFSRAHTGINNEEDNNGNSNGLPKSADHKKHMDERRLKEILEELYKDKKYFDHVIDTTDDTDLNIIVDERDLAEHGRERLLDTAEVWDQKQRDNPMPLPPWFVPSRMNTTMRYDYSGRGSQISQTSTATPVMYDLNGRRSVITSKQEVTSENMRSTTSDLTSSSGKAKPSGHDIVKDANDTPNNEPSNTLLPGQQPDESQKEAEEEHAQSTSPSKPIDSSSNPPSRKSTPMF